MKKLLSVIIVLALVVMIIPQTAVAVESSSEKQEILYYDDGSCLIVTIQETTLRSSDSKLGTKTYQYVSASGNLEWTAILRGYFYYDGSTSTCTSSVCDITISNSNWYVVNKRVWTSGNSACSEFTMGLKLLGVTATQKYFNMSLMCDAYGNLS